jgi:aminoglycoside 3-N-acetyltransferase
MISVNCQDLIAGLRDLGLQVGDKLIVHSSLRSMGYVEGGAHAVIEAILDVLGETGTLLVPTLTGKREDSKLHPPVFEVMTTPCWTGIIPETIRQMPNAKRSLHPTHSIASLGYQRDYLTYGHETSQSPCDEKSPYYKNSICNGYIMLIGVDQESNTSIHSCEEIAKVPYHLQKDVTASYITSYEGEKIWVSNRLHNWSKPATDFNKLDGLYREQSIMKIGKIGAAEIRLINAVGMFQFTIDLLKKNPFFLLSNTDICTDIIS